MDEDVIGDGRSRYGGDFPSNVSATWLVEGRMNDNFLGPGDTWAGSGTSAGGKKRRVDD